MSRVPLLLNASRCVVAFSLLVGISAYAAASGASGKTKDPASSPVATVSESPSFALLGLGLVAIGLHGLGRSRRHR
ncbi:MAG: hypothetical protein Q7V20_14140 [Aquabacterium sp.]|uniref:hypothetical protein n=1 Tax=Aquabacterium sp. TaxID=1872578 RepID=UPI0027251B9E|nr:hypothetical protein [Aquabacterium sp.]MDO9004584.1 hypothetical protein [Aquabacterium sp.]